MPPTIEVKNFESKDEIDLAIRKLNRRIADVEELGVSGVSSRGQEVDNVEEHIRNDIVQIFGQYSPQAQAHQHHRIWSGPVFMGMDSHDHQQAFEKGLPETYKMIKGLVKQLEEYKEDLDFRPAKPTAQQESLRPPIGSSHQPIQININNENRIIVDIQFSISQIIQSLDANPDLSGPQKVEAEARLTELEGELKKPNPQWGVVKSTLMWALDFSKDVFLQVLPIILKHYIPGP